MKSLRVIYILFLLLSVNTNATNFIISETFYRGIEIDSSYINSQFNLNKESANSIIQWHKKALVKGVDFSNEDLKSIAISYAYLKDTSNAIEYLEKYIKKSHDIDVLNNSVFVNINKSNSYKSIITKFKPKLNGWIIFFFSTGLIGIFIAIVLNLRKKGDVTANILISLFVLLHSLFTIHLSLFLSNYSYNFPHSLYITSLFSFLYGPLLYFYFKRIVSKYRFKPIDALHLLPSIGLLIYLTPIYLLSADEKLDILFNRFDNTEYSLVITVVVIKCISLITYGYLVFKIYRDSLNTKSKQHIAISKWKRNMVIINSIYVLSYVIYGLAVINQVFVNILIYPQIFAMSTIVLYVGYTAYVQPRVFSKKHLFNQVGLKYLKSGLTESFSHDLKEQLLQLLTKEKIFKNNNINLDILSQKLETTRHNLSQVINEHFDVNFFNLINSYRIQEAQEMFKSDIHNNLNIIDVAYDVGFNNKVTFNKAFKDQTNLTPSQYIKNLNNNRFKALA